MLETEERQNLGSNFNDNLNMGQDRDSLYKSRGGLPVAFCRVLDSIIGAILTGLYSIGKFLSYIKLLHFYDNFLLTF